MWIKDLDGNLLNLNNSILIRLVSNMRYEIEVLMQNGGIYTLYSSSLKVKVQTVKIELEKLLRSNECPSFIELNEILTLCGW